MIKYDLKHSYLLVAMLLLFWMTGCEKKINITDTIAKDETLKLMSLDEIIQYDNYEQMNYQVPYKNSEITPEQITMDVIREELKYNSEYVVHDGNYTQEDLENDYRIVFHFTLENRSRNRFGNDLAGIVLLPCDSTLQYDNLLDYPVYFRFYGTRTNDLPKHYIAHFKIDALKNIGYIAENPNQQQDLCLFEKMQTGGMGETVYISSNKLIYTAEEINAVMDEYEALK